MKKIRSLIEIVIFLGILTVPAMAADRPTVIMTFDDGWLSVYDKAYPIMQSNGQNGVAFVYITPITGGYGGFMNQTQLDPLYGTGWDISSHTYSHTVLTTANVTTLNYELNASRNWLNMNGYPRGAMFLAYPEGAYNQAVIDAVKANYYVAARSVDSPNGTYSHHNLSNADVFALKDYETIGGYDNDTTIINQINNTIVSNGLLILSFHKIVDNYNIDPIAAETEFLTSDFQNISNYLKSRSIDVDVRTLSDYFGTTALVVHMPPAPINMTSIIGIGAGSNNYINVSWLPGIGDNTDIYNMDVNGVLSNTTNIYVNITNAIPGVLYDIKVYAVNTTDGNVVNQTPATISAIIPLYVPPVPIVVNQTSDNSGGFWTYFEWTNGTTENNGNITDFYNYSVNGIWTNLSINKSVNITTVPHGQVNVSVYAYNSSNGGVQSITPLMMSTQMQNNLIEIGNIWAEYDIYAGDILRIVPTVYNPDNDTVRFTTNATKASMNNSTGEFVLNTSSGDEGEYHWNITAYDDQGLPQIIDFMVSITTKPSPPSNSDGGNSGGNSGGSIGDSGSNAYDPNVLLYEIRDSQIRNGIKSNIMFTKNNFIFNVTFQGIRNYGDVSVKATILKENPTPNYLDNVYRFFSISLGTMFQKNEYLYISNSTVTICVNKSDLNGHNMSVYRYVNDSWMPVDIEDMHLENNDTKQFELKSNGLFNFALVLEQEESDQVPMVEDNTNSEIENSASLTGNTMVDNTIKQVSKIPESLYRKIINMIKKYMPWI